jgi:hypothetical protein
MLGSVLAQLVRSETSLKWPRALLQISPSALGIQFGSRARRYNISRARRSVKQNYEGIAAFNLTPPRRRFPRPRQGAPNMAPVLDAP